MGRFERPCRVEAEWVLRFDAAYEDIWNPVVIETVESNLVFERMGREICFTGPTQISFGTNLKEKFEKIVQNLSGLTDPWKDWEQS